MNIKHISSYGRMISLSSSAYPAICDIDTKSVCDTRSRQITLISHLPHMNNFKLMSKLARLHVSYLQVTVKLIWNHVQLGCYIHDIETTHVSCIIQTPAWHNIQSHLIGKNSNILNYKTLITLNSWLMKHKGSIPHSLELLVNPYPEPNKPNL